MPSRTVKRLLLFGQMGGGGLLPYTDNFTYANGPLANGWESGGSTWTISSNAVINTPTLGSELIVNGGFGADSDWTKGANWTIAAGVATKSGGVANNLTQIPLTDTTWYRAVGTLASYGGAGVFNIIFGATNNVGTSVTANATVTNSSRATGTLAGILGNAASSGNWDNVSYKAITLNTLFATKNFGRNDVDATVKATIISGNRCGLVLCLDSVSSPANFVMATHDRVNARLSKCVGGVYTELINTAATYSAGAAIRVTKSGNTFKLFYNGSQVGADQTISDAGIVSNTRHGMAQTYELNSLDDFTIEAE